MSPVFVVTVGDAIGLAAFALVVIWFLGSAAWTWIRQYLCRHERTHENRQCHAICRDCGKDLGFIQTWREKQEAKKGATP